MQVVVDRPHHVSRGLEQLPAAIRKSRASEKADQPVRGMDLSRWLPGGGPCPPRLGRALRQARLRVTSNS